MERVKNMNSAEQYSEIKELNLSYLMLAQQMVRGDREGAMFRLGINADVADVVNGLTPGQMLKMAGSNMLLCRFRFDDNLLLGSAVRARPRNRDFAFARGDSRRRQARRSLGLIDWER